MKGEYEAAVFEYSEDGPGAYTIMALRIRKTHSILRSAGWHDGHFYFLKVDGGITYADYEPRVFANRFTAADDEELLRLLKQIVAGVKTLKEVDGRTYYQEDLRVVEDVQ